MADQRLDPTNQAPPVAPPVSPSGQPVPPAPPKLKEQEPVTQAESPAEGETRQVRPADKIAKEEGDAYWERYAREIEIEKELEALGGIEKVESGEVKVPKDIAAEMGIKPAVTIETPISKATDFTVRGVSLTDDQLSAGLTKPISSGLRWLVEWFIYQLLKAHFFVKKIHGKIFRRKDES